MKTFWFLICCLTLLTPIKTETTPMSSLNQQIKETIVKTENNMIVTYYAPLDNKSGICADSSPTTTSTMTYPGPGTIAVNPDIIPYGSIVVIKYEDNTIEAGIACDTGGIIRASTNRIDVFRPTYKMAMRDGKRIATVYHWKNDNI